MGLRDEDDREMQKLLSDSGVLKELLEFRWRYARFRAPE